MYLKRELDNCHDKYTVAIVKANGARVGYIPYILASVISPFLQETSTKVPLKSQGKESIAAQDMT